MYTPFLKKDGNQAAGPHPDDEPREPAYKFIYKIANKSFSIHGILVITQIYKLETTFLLLLAYKFKLTLYN